jgi:hypothetical protein
MVSAAATRVCEGIYHVRISSQRREKRAHAVAYSLGAENRARERRLATLFAQLQSVVRRLKSDEKHGLADKLGGRHLHRRLRRKLLLHVSTPNANYTDS